MMALGLTLVYGLLRILHVAHAGVFALGAYAGVLTANATGSLWLAVPAAIGVSAALGPLIYRFVYAPMLSRASLRGADRLHRPLHRDGGRPSGSSSAPTACPSTTTRGSSPPTIWEASISMRCRSRWRCPRWSSPPPSGPFVSATRIGVAWRATVSDPQMAQSFGIDPVRVRYLNFAIGSAMAGAAGAARRTAQQPGGAGHGRGRELQGPRDHRARGARQRPGGRWSRACSSGSSRASGRSTSPPSWIATRSRSRC